MNDRALIGVGAAGAVLAAICCATPLLAVAASSPEPFVDAVGLPLVGLSLGWQVRDWRCFR